MTLRTSIDECLLLLLILCIDASVETPPLEFWKINVWGVQWFLLDLAHRFRWKDDWFAWFSPSISLWFMVIDHSLIHGHRSLSDSWPSISLWFMVLLACYCHTKQRRRPSSRSTLRPQIALQNDLKKTNLVHTTRDNSRIPRRLSRGERRCMLHITGISCHYIYEYQSWRNIYGKESLSKQRPTRLRPEQYILQSIETTTTCAIRYRGMIEVYLILSEKKSLNGGALQPQNRPNFPFCVLQYVFRWIR